MADSTEMLQFELGNALRSQAMAGFVIQQQPVHHPVHSKAALLTSVEREMTLIISFSIYISSQK